MLTGHTRRSQLALGAVTVALACASCAPTVTVDSSRPVPIALSEYRIRPSSLIVSAGTVSFDVHNYGRLTHDLVITPRGRTDSVADSGGLSPGRSEVIHVRLRAGVYLLTSDVAVDQSVGQTGTLVVTSN